VLFEIAEIRRFAVLPGFRGQGVGRRELSRLLGELRSEGCERIVLELRASNVAAMALYGGAGFKVDRLRRNYYASPPENGVDMSLELSEPGRG
jgi:ribosomal-protein-alanine N-acetyltransferase